MFIILLSLHRQGISMSLLRKRKLSLREIKWFAPSYSVIEEQSWIQILIFGFQVYILGSFQHSIVWDMLVDFEMPMDNSCGCNQLRMKVKVKVLVIQSFLTLCDPMDCSPPVSSVQGILQARLLEWVAIPFSRGSSQPRDRTQVSWTAGRFFTIWAIGEALSWEWGSGCQERSWDWTERFQDHLQR